MDHSSKGGMRREPGFEHEAEGQKEASGTV